MAYRRVRILLPYFYIKKKSKNMNTQERIQLIEALAKVVEVNSSYGRISDADLANEEILALTKSMTKPTGDIVLTSNHVRFKSSGTPLAFTCYPRNTFMDNLMKEPKQEPKEEKKINLQAVERLLNDAIDLMSKNKYFTHEGAINDKIYWRKAIGYTLEDLK